MCALEMRRRPAPPSKLKELRVARGLSQADLAAAAGLSPGWISLLERNASFLTSRTSDLLAQALGVGPEEFGPPCEDEAQCNTGRSNSGRPK